MKQNRDLKSLFFGVLNVFTGQRGWSESALNETCQSSLICCLLCVWFTVADWTHWFNLQKCWFKKQPLHIVLCAALSFFLAWPQKRTSPFNEWVSDWVNEQPIFQNWSDIYSCVLIGFGCCPFKFNLWKQSLRPQGAFCWVFREVWLNNVTKIQKRLHELLNKHIDVVSLCCDWDSDPTCIMEKDK